MVIIIKFLKKGRKVEIFEGNPKDKFFDIIFHASKTLVENEIENLLMRAVALENLCEKAGIDETEIFNFIVENPDIMENALNDKYIELTGNILSNNE